MCLFQADLSITLNCEVYSKGRKMEQKEKGKSYVLFQVVTLQGLGATR